MKFPYWLQIAACLFSVCLSAETKSVEVGGVSRPYYVHVPSSLKEGQKVPLVVMLHGAGGSADRAEDHYGWTEKANAEGFIAVFPEAAAFNPEQAADMKNNPHVWDDGSGVRKPIDDISYLRAVINAVKKQYPVDPSRVYMTGFSNGASMAFRAGIELSDILTAVAPVAGRLYGQDHKLAKPISILLIVGTEDPINPLNGIMGQHHLKGPMIDSIKKWLPLLALDEFHKSVKGLDGGATATIYGPNEFGAQAIFVVVPQQRHEWPGSRVEVRGVELEPKSEDAPQKPFSATDEIWNFFNSTKSK